MTDVAHEPTTHRPGVFTLTGFPILWACSWVNDWSPDVYLWEPIRRLDPRRDRFIAHRQDRRAHVQRARELGGRRGQRRAGA